MITQHTYSLPVVWDPDNEPNNATAKQIASSGREISNLKLATAGGGSAVVFLYDNANGVPNPTDLRWVMDSGSGTPDANEFASPLAFKKGIYAVLSQGAGLRAILCISILPDQV